jgi:hypothetical protein
VAKAGGVSTSVYRKTCRACDVRARHLRDLIRFLRALSRSKEDGSLLRSHLAGDPETLVSLFDRAGLPLDSRFVPLPTFIRNQKFIPPTNRCLRELAHMAANDSLFFADFRSDEQKPEIRQDPQPRRKRA